MIQTAKDYVPGFVKRRNPIVINIGATYRFLSPIPRGKQNPGTYE